MAARLKKETEFICKGLQNNFLIQNILRDEDKL